MRQGFWIRLSNAGGVLDRVFVETEAETVAAVTSLITLAGHLTDGDTITVEAGESELD